MRGRRSESTWRARSTGAAEAAVASSMPHSAAGCKLCVRAYLPVPCALASVHVSGVRAAASARGFPAGGAGVCQPRPQAFFKLESIFIDQALNPQRHMTQFTRTCQAGYDPGASRAQRLPRRAHVPMTGRAGHMRLGTRPLIGRRRSLPEMYYFNVAGGTCAVFRFRSALVSVSGRILRLLLVACRSSRAGARVIHACAVGTARRGARIGRPGAPCKAGNLRWC
jgi:hypothetical protein